MQYGNIEIKSLVLYGGMEEQFLNLTPLYYHAYKAWEASANGQDLEDIQKLAGVYEEYESFKAKAEELEKKIKEEPTDEVKAEYEKAMGEATKLALKITKHTQSVAGLTKKQQENLAVKRQEYLDLMNKLIGIIASGLREDDLETKVAGDFQSLREPVKKRLIYDVSEEPENGQPLGFTQRLGEITPVLLNIHLSRSTQKSSQTSTAGDKESE